MNDRLWPKAASILEHFQDEIMTAYPQKRPFCYRFSSRLISAHLAHI
jgi:hypothetical protein